MFQLMDKKIMTILCLKMLIWPYDVFFQVQTRDYLCRAIYCGMLGYDVSFAYIHAVKLAQQGSLLEKRIGIMPSLKNCLFAITQLTHSKCHLPKKIYGYFGEFLFNSIFRHFFFIFNDFLTLEKKLNTYTLEKL